MVCVGGSGQKGKCMEFIFEKRYIPDSPAQRLNEAMGLGFNLGNTLDATMGGKHGITGLDLETAWGNPKTTRQMISAIRAGGIKTMRVPVSWHDHVSGTDDRIDKAWLDRVCEIVGWCLDEDMFVQLNTHHDIVDGFLVPGDAGFPRAKAFMENVWGQLAETFRDVDGEKLLFESMNEIRMRGEKYEWTPDYENPGCVTAMENINRLNEAFLKTVRNEGGENAQRYLIIPGYSTSTEGVCWDGFRLPEDSAQGRLLVASHVYSPAHFAFYLKDGDNLTVFDPDDRAFTAPLDERLEKLYDKFVKNGIPVTINEFGAVDKDNDPERTKCLGYTVAKARSLGIQCCYWDNGKLKEYGDGMAIFDRNTCTFVHREMLDVML